MIKNLFGFENLQLNTKIYEANADGPIKYHYYGINPRDKQSVMLGMAGSVNDITGKYIGEKDVIYYLNYDECCFASLDLAAKRVEIVRRIFCDKPKPATL